MPLLRPSKITAWFVNRFAEPTPAQAQAWPVIEAGGNVLIVSPTGTGKTFAAFLSVLHELALQHEAGRLKQTIHAIYVSPLRALSYDLEKNLQMPLREIYGADPPIRVGLRSGDTSGSDRQKQFTKPPHILLTTPESLSLLLSQRKWVPHLETVRWLIIDEIHALAENKRGAHLSLSVTRLDYLRSLRRESPSVGVANPPDPLQRIGLSATVAPVGEVAEFLAGTGRSCVVVDASAAKKIDLQAFTHPFPGILTRLPVTPGNASSRSSPD